MSMRVPAGAGTISFMGLPGSSSSRLAVSKIGMVPQPPAAAAIARNVRRLRLLIVDALLCLFLPSIGRAPVAKAYAALSRDDKTQHRRLSEIVRRDAGSPLS